MLTDNLTNAQRALPAPLATRLMEHAFSITLERDCVSYMARFDSQLNLELTRWLDDKEQLLIDGTTKLINDSATKDTGFIYHEAMHAGTTIRIILT